MRDSGPSSAMTFIFRIRLINAQLGTWAPLNLDALHPGCKEQNKTLVTSGFSNKKEACYPAKENSIWNFGFGVSTTMRKVFISVHI